MATLAQDNIVLELIVKGNQQTTNQVKGLRKEVTGLGGTLKGLGKQLAAGVSIGAFIALTKDAAKTVGEFEVALKSLGSITGLSGRDLDNLGNRAVDLSLKFGTSASEILKGFQIIGSAKPELLASGEALAEVTEQAEILAKAAGLTLPQSGAALTKSLNQFGGSAADAAKFTDILATSQQKGTATISQLSDALKNVGSVAAASNISFEQTNVLLQALAKGGTVGAEAGTQLRGTLLKLAQTGREELNPATQDFNDILNVLEKEVTTVTEAAALFGAENAAAALTLIKQKEVVEDLTGALNEQGNALAQATNNTSTATAENEKFRASWDALILSIDTGNGILSNAYKGTISSLGTILNQLTEVNKGQRTFLQFLAGFAASGTPFAAVLDARIKADAALASQQQRTASGQTRGIGGSDTIANIKAAAEATEFYTQELKTLQDELNLLEVSQSNVEKGSDRYIALQSEIVEKNFEVVQAEEDLAFIRNRSAELSKKALSEQVEGRLNLAELTQRQKALETDLADARLNDEKERAEILQSQLSEVNKLIAKTSVDSVKETKAAVDKEAEFAENSLKALQEQLAALNKEREGTDINDIATLTALTNQIESLKTDIAEAQLLLDNLSGSAPTEFAPLESTNVDGVESQNPIVSLEEAIQEDLLAVTERGLKLRELAEQRSEQIRQERRRQNAKDAAAAIGNGLLEVTELIGKNTDRRVSFIDKEIAKQEERVNALTDLDSKASDEQIATEKKRLEELEEQRKKALRNQRVIALAEIAINNAQAIGAAIKAISEGGPGQALVVGAAITAIVKSVSGAFSEIPAFKEGIEDTGNHKSDGFLAMLHNNERVVPEGPNKKLLAMGVSNKDLPELVEAGLSTKTQQAVNSQRATPQADMSGVETRLDKLNRKLSALEMNVSLDKKGFAASMQNYTKRQQERRKLN